MLAGGPAAFVATGLLAGADEPLPISLYIIAGEVIEIIAIVSAPETRDRAE